MTKAENNFDRSDVRDAKTLINASEEVSFYLTRQADSRFRLTVSFSFTLKSSEKSFLFEIEIDVFTDFTFSAEPLSVNQLYRLYLLAGNAAKGKLNEKLIPIGSGRMIVWNSVPFADIERKLLALLRPTHSES